jgi:hypothetical protein
MSIQLLLYDYTIIRLTQDYKSFLLQIRGKALDYRCGGHAWRFGNLQRV